MQHARAHGRRRARHERDADGDQRDGCRRPRRHGTVGPGGVHHPAARGLVLVRAPRADPSHVRPDDPRPRRGARARWHGARRPRRARRRARASRWAPRSASRVTSSRSSRPPRCCTTSGQVCLDEPDDGRPPEPVSVAQAGATILRGTQLLAPAGDIIAAEWMPLPRAASSSRPSVMSGQILKVASAFDELSDGHADRAGLALEALCSAPEYLYDARGARGARDRARPAGPARRSARAEARRRRSHRRAVAARGCPRSTGRRCRARSRCRRSRTAGSGSPAP